MRKLLFLALASGAWSFACAQFTVEQLSTTIGGRPVARLSYRPPSAPTSPVITSVDILPGRGMNTFQLRAQLPGKGEVELIESPSLSEAAAKLNAPDPFGNESFRLGGAILFPFANRIRGKVSGDALTTEILGQTVNLPANWKGQRKGAEVHSMHGLILGTAFEKVHLSGTEDRATLTASLEAGDFGGHWPSRTQVTIGYTLDAQGLLLTVEARNTGSAKLPIGIGWHPYFRLPSADRKQAKLYIPARQRAIVNNYDDVFPVGALTPVKSRYDYSPPGGAELGPQFLDDNYVDFKRDPATPLTVELRDPAANFGLRLSTPTRQVKAVQVYAPVDKPFVVIEPQFNWGDPFGAVWKPGTDTGMVILDPGQSIRYEVRMHLFVP